jgi:hypothetical protein
MAALSAIGEAVYEPLRPLEVTAWRSAELTDSRLVYEEVEARGRHLPTA